VLPFKSLNLDANDEYLGLGIADDLITRLSNIKQIVVRPRLLCSNTAGQTKTLLPLVEN
jgi:TolB-like protein